VRTRKAPLRRLFFVLACCACDSGVGISRETLAYQPYCSRHRAKSRLALAALATARILPGTTTTAAALAIAALEFRARRLGAGMHRPALRTCRIRRERNPASVPAVLLAPSRMSALLSRRSSRWTCRSCASECRPLEQACDGHDFPVTTVIFAGSYGELFICASIAIISG